VLLTGAVLLALLLPQLGAAPLVRAEIYFLDAARSMVESGDWLVPYYQGEPFFDKPILTYWLMAAAMKALGPTPAAARLVPVLASLGFVLASVWLGTLLYDRRSALAGGLVLSTTLAFLSFARVAMSDMLLALFSTLAVALAVRACRPGAPRYVVPLLGAVAGLGFATKGPIALLIPGLAILLLLYENRSRPLPGGLGGLALGAVLCAVLGLGWFVLVYQRLGSEPLAYFFLRENLQRFAAETYDVGRPFWFYLPVYFAEGLPWSPLLPLALVRLLRSGDAQERGAARFLAAWVALVLVPLSLSRGKLDYYLLPLYPAISLLVGRQLVAVEWRRLDRATVRVLLVTLAAALVFLLLRPPQLPEQWMPSPAARALVLGVLGACALSLLAVAVRPRPRTVLLSLASVVAAVWLGVVTLCLPAFVAGQPNREMVEDVSRELRYRPDLRMAFCSDPTRVRRDVLLEVRISAIAECDLWSFAGSREPFLLLATPAQDASFRVDKRYRHIATYRYLPADTLTLQGLFAPSTPAEIILGANYPTKDPVAKVKRKREYRKMLDREQGLAAVP
jgi:4-amino-4-deoxy-L-arabinose transferase-like glycosyltransferase